MAPFFWGGEAEWGAAAAVGSGWGGLVRSATEILGPRSYVKLTPDQTNLGLDACGSLFVLHLWSHALKK